MQQSSGILLVEDEAGDVEQFRRLADKFHLDADITVVADGAEALEFLTQEHKKNARLEISPTCPFVVVTDLNMPGMSGMELISELRNDPRFDKMSVFVVTTSNLESDVHEAYGYGIAGFINKDVAGVRMKDAIQMLRYYVQSVTLAS